MMSMKSLDIHGRLPMPATRLLIICTLGALAGILVTLLHPVNSMALKLAFLTCLTGSWGGLTILMWQRKHGRFLLLSLPCFLVIAFFLPGPEIDRAELQRDYVRRMSELEGTKYHWGGESTRGIDCSGLPRKALRDAFLAYGTRHGNGSALRACLEQWWFDASAKALSQGYREYTVPLEIRGTIRTMTYDSLIPGDLAVTTSGIHVLAYVGNGQWIQADPGIGAVATLDGRSADNSWFDSPVTTHRWQAIGKIGPTTQ
jgi:NlpC/P60 family